MNLIAIGENVCDIYIPEGTMHPGGQCANTAVYAQMLGIHASYLGEFGSDLPGKIMQKALSSYGVDISRCRVIEGESGYCRIEHRDKDRIFAGSNLFGVMQTHPMKLSDEDWDYIRSADVIYTDINSQMLSYLPQMKETGIPVAFDFSAKVQDEDLIRIAPFVTIASLSLAHLTEEERLRKMKLMADQGTPYVLGTIGKEGSLLLDQEKLYHEPAADTEKIVDTLGAGDAYFTALLKALFGSGRSVPSAMHEAAAFASRVIGWEGAYPFPKTEENYDKTVVV